MSHILPPNKMHDIVFFFTYLPTIVWVRMVGSTVRGKQAIFNLPNQKQFI